MLKTRIGDPQWETHTYEDETYWGSYETEEGYDPISSYNADWYYYYPVLHPKHQPTHKPGFLDMEMWYLTDSMKQEMTRQLFGENVLLNRLQGLKGIVDE